MRHPPLLPRLIRRTRWAILRGLAGCRSERRGSPSAVVVLVGLQLRWVTDRLTQADTPRHLAFVRRCIAHADRRALAVAVSFLLRRLRHGQRARSLCAREPLEAYRRELSMALVRPDCPVHVYRAYTRDDSLLAVDGLVAALDHALVEPTRAGRGVLLAALLTSEAASRFHSLNGRDQWGGMSVPDRAVQEGRLGAFFRRLGHAPSPARTRRLHAQFVARDTNGSLITAVPYVRTVGFYATWLAVQGLGPEELADVMVAAALAQRLDLVTVPLLAHPAYGATAYRMLAMAVARRVHGDAGVRMAIHLLLRWLARALREEMVALDVATLDAICTALPWRVAGGTSPLIEGLPDELLLAVLEAAPVTEWTQRVWHQLAASQPSAAVRVAEHWAARHGPAGLSARVTLDALATLLAANDGAVRQRALLLLAALQLAAPNASGTTPSTPANPLAIAGST